MWEAKRDEEVIRDIRVNSKKFWGAYKAQNKSEGNISLVDWTAYFGGAEGLFSGSGGDAVLVASREAGATDPRARALLFPPPDASRDQQAAFLNQDVSASEVARALRSVANV